MIGPGRLEPCGRRGPLGRGGLARGLAWGLLLGVTGYLVHGEVVRPETPAGLKVARDLAYDSSGSPRSRLDVYTPAGPAPVGGWPAVVAIHGGGWRGGSRSDYGLSLAELARRGVAVVAIDYRLSRPGSTPWPGNLEDVQSAIEWVGQRGPRFGIDPDRVALMGASAGGHLALLAGLEPRPGSRDPGAGSVRVRAVIDFYGPTDLQALALGDTAAAGAVTSLLGGTPDQFPARYEAASPVRRVRPGCPPVLLLHGDEDRLIPVSQSRSLADRLEQAGVPHRFRVVAGARHGFGLQAGTADLTPEVLAFLESAWKD